MLGEAAGREPIAIRADYDVSTIFVVGPGVEQRAMAEPRIAERLLERRPPRAAIEPATDDWPFLYLKRRDVPIMPYGAVIFGVLAVSVILLRVGLRGGSAAPDWHMFFLGAGFMLIEVRAISQLSLLFGSTWLVNSVVISTILLMGLLGNLFVAVRRPASSSGAYVLLGIAIVGGLGLPPDLFAGTPLMVRTFVGGAPFALPMLFAAVIFASGFRRRRDPARSIGWNLLGAVVGGSLEYLSMSIGLSALGVIALGLYALSLAALVQRHQRAVRAAPATGL
jgi:hypothetical protein